MKRLIPIVLLALMLTGCATLDRACVSLKSDINNGLNRTIVVYTANGDVIARYEGKIDLATSEDGSCYFDYNGKRYVYYNCFIETIADIE